ncbi:MAG: metal ABC transporter ATP-binding protein [Spirochaetaceae bacterium]|jgi:zinc transport system ATP-binding protein|nr:metal ABC transporter ATP-binding protein [Spirochaetaceae bacterium]
MILIRCRDLSFAYEGNPAVRRLNFAVEGGEYLCIAGENGSGKSTLIKGLLGLIQPQGGSLLREAFRQNEIGYLPQYRAARMDFPAGVFEVALSGRLGRRGLRPFYSLADRRAAEENLDALGIGDLRKKCYRELSGGQQQRVLIARALCAARKLLILDEPAAGLDPVISAELYRTLQRLNRERGLTVIMVTHDIQGALPYADRILHLKTDQIFWGTRDEYADSDIGRKFLGDPRRVMAHD